MPNRTSSTRRQTLAGPSTPPTRRTRFHRSTLPASDDESPHSDARSRAGSIRLKVTAASSPEEGSSTHGLSVAVPPAPRTPSRVMHSRHRSDDPFGSAWSVPRSPVGVESDEEFGGKKRLAFTSTPTTTYYSTRNAKSSSSRSNNQRNRPGRQISLSNLGEVFGGIVPDMDYEGGSSFTTDSSDREEVLEDSFDGEEMPMRGYSASAVLDLTGEGYDEDGDAVSVASTASVYVSEGEAVDVALDFGGGVLASPGLPLDALAEASVPSTPKRDRNAVAEAVGLTKENLDLLAAVDLMEVLDSPDGTAIKIYSPGHTSSPRMNAPAAPETPSRDGAVRYDSDDSESFIPRSRRPLAKRRVVASDDEDSPAPAVKPRGRIVAFDDEEDEGMRAMRPKAKGLRGRVPAAIQRLEADSDEDAYTTERFLDESAGSLGEFIVADHESESGVSSAEEVDENDTSAVFTDGEDEIEVVDGASFFEAAAVAVPATPKAKHEVIEIGSSDDDSDDAILAFSPPPRPAVTLPDIASLTITATPSPPKPPPRDPRRGIAAPKMRAPLTPAKQLQATPSTPATETKAKRGWAKRREAAATEFFNELDSAVFGNKLGAAGADTKLEWTNRLLTTAGTATKRKTTHADGTVKISGLKISLATKVLTGEEQLRSTLAHEMCHIATWYISGDNTNPHGRVFKSWGAKVMRARPDVQVTTKHNYEIDYKYSWSCTNASCGKVYGRHSKSIDTAKQACGKCRSPLKPMFETKGPTAYSAYIKEYSPAARAALPGASNAEVWKALGARWKADQAGDHGAYWAERAAAVTRA